MYFGILYKKGETNLLEYCEVDYDGDLDTRCSTTGYVLILDQNISVGAVQENL